MIAIPALRAVYSVIPPKRDITTHPKEPSFSPSPLLPNVKGRIWRRSARSAARSAEEELREEKEELRKEKEAKEELRKEHGQAKELLMTAGKDILRYSRDIEPKTKQL